MGLVGPPPVVLFAGEDLDWSRWIRVELRRRGARVIAVPALGELAHWVAEEPPDVILIDDAWGVAIPLLRRRRPQARIALMVSRLPQDEETMRELFQADSRILKPPGTAEVMAFLEECLAGRLAGRGPELVHTPRVLCVDDDIMFLKSVERVLVREGYRVSVASSGAEALDEAQREPPDIALVDVAMPQMNGLEVAQHLRGVCPVVLLTGVRDAATHARARDLDIVQYLTKPCLPRTLLNVVDYVTEERREETGVARK